MEWLVMAIHCLHLFIVVLIVAGAVVVCYPMKYPRLWKYVVGMYVVVPLVQGVFGGNCPLTLLAYWLEGKYAEHPSFFRDVFGFDIPWPVTLLFGVIVSTAAVAPMVIYRNRWINYQKALLAQQKKGGRKAK